MSTTAVNMGPLSCTLVRDPSQTPTALVVLCHGYGATGRDLVALADVLRHAVPQPNGICFLFPQAPLSLAEVGLPGGRAWWHLDAEVLMARARQGEAARLALQEETFPGLPAARRQLRATVDAALLAFNLSYAQLTLGGFSQGAMLTTDLTLRLEEPPAALVVLSGTLIDAANWRRLAASRRGLRVLQSHGEADPILPYAGAKALRELLEAAGCSVDFLSFSGGHTIVPEAIERCAALLAGKISG